ncbi:MAG: homoserine O-acetyltransferase [Methanocorpusculum parvum]|nr:homoserine O-acetyltransferase [Methanocorpusculum parvum]
MLQDSVGEVTTHYHTLTRPVDLESGASLSDVIIAYERYGRKDNKNVILVCHALTGDAHAAGFHKGDTKPGWWNGIIGPGKALDTNRYCVIATNVLGGCKGSTGPSSIDPTTGNPYGITFPGITIRDMVHAEHLLLEDLGIEELYAVIGGSMGGMQAMQWSVEFPAFVRRVICIASAGYSTPMHIAFGAVGRAAIMSDQNWNNGNYSAGKKPDRGLSLARMMAHITYLSDESMHTKFGRRLQKSEAFGYGFDTEFSVESYLQHQGEMFVERFDPNSYLYITRAVDYYDLTKNGSLTDGLAETEAKFLIISVSSDWLYPPYLSQEIMLALSANGKEARYAEIVSPHGHDGFLLENAQLNYMVGQFLTPITVEDLMMHDPPSIRETSSIREAAELMIGHEINHLPVVLGDGTLSGIVTSWDIAKSVAGNFQNLAEIMTKDVITIQRSDSLRLAASLMEKHAISALPVVDNAGRVLGMLTSETLSLSEVLQ